MKSKDFRYNDKPEKVRFEINLQTLSRTAFF